MFKKLKSFPMLIWRVTYCHFNMRDFVLIFVRGEYVRSTIDHVLKLGRDKDAKERRDGIHLL